MDYTKSDAYVTHPGTGERMHQDTAPITTMVTADDMNMVIWSLMEVINAAGVSGAQFDPDVASTYSKFLEAIRIVCVRGDSFKALQNAAVAHSDGSNTLYGSARYFLGNATPSSDDSALLIGRSLTGSYASGAHAIRDESTYAPSGGGFFAYASWDSAVNLIGSGATYDHLRSFQARPNFGGSGTLGELSGVYAQVSNTGTGSVANAFGVFVADPTGAGAIPNNYGIWVQPLSRGSSNNQAIVTSGSTPSTFGGVINANGGIIGSTMTMTGQASVKSAHSTGVASSFNSTGGLAVSYNGSGNGQIQAYANGSGAGPATLALVCGGSAVMNLNGTSATPGADNAYTLGSAGARWSSVWAATGTINTSDARAKAEVQPSSLGLDFIKSLRPVSYLYKVGKSIPIELEDGVQEVEIEPAHAEQLGPNGEVIFPATAAVMGEVKKFKTIYEPVPGQRRHWGLIAQEVKQAVELAGVDFAGWVQDDPENPESLQGLRYDQFIAPLVKAVQDLSETVDDLRIRLSSMEAIVRGKGET